MRAVALLALLLALPAALAGTEESPEVTDGADQQRASVDLLAAWVENEHDGLRFTIKVRGFDGAPPQHVYGLGFTIEGGARHVAVVGVDTSGHLHTIVDRVGYGKSIEELPDNLREAALRPGEPAYVSARIPWGAVAGFEPGARITILYALTDDAETPTGGRDYVDLAESGRSFTLAAAAAPATASAWLFPLALAAVFAAAGAGAFYWSRRRT